MKKKVVLAYSGGLDTSYCVKYLKKELNLDVHSVLVNTGGFTNEELDSIQIKAVELGVDSHTALEQTNEFYTKIIKYLIYGNILKNNTYPLSVSAERIHQAFAIVEYAKSMNADYIAHGSTGAGNDQVRFDLVFQLIAPEIQILTPIRDQQLSRKEEIEYLKKSGVEMNWEKAKYSINKGLWGTSIGGEETLTSNKRLPEAAFPSKLVKTESEKLKLTFKQGEIVGVNGENLKSVAAIQKVESIAKLFAIGRDVHVGDTIIGIKGRVGFEAPAAQIIIKAHHLLEKHTLSKWQLHWKEQLANWYGMFLHEAQYFDPVMRNIEGFLESTQNHVSGDVFIELHPYRFTLEGIESNYDLMDSEFGDYGEMNKQWTAQDVKGFTKILGNSIQIFNSKNSVVC